MLKGETILKKIENEKTGKRDCHFQKWLEVEPYTKRKGHPPLERGDLGERLVPPK